MCFCYCDICYTERLENFLLFFHSVSIIFILCCLVTIKWSNLRYQIGHLILFVFMELMHLACLIFASLLSLWRAFNVIKSIKIKEKAKTIAFISFILIISLLVIMIPEIFLFCYELISDEEKNDKYNSNAEEINSEEIFILFCTYTVLELGSIIGIFIWYNLKFRINYGIKKPNPTNNYISSTRQTTTERKLKYEPNKRKKIKSKFDKFSNNKINQELLELSNLELLSLK